MVWFTFALVTGVVPQSRTDRDTTESTNIMGTQQKTRWATGATPDAPGGGWRGERGSIAALDAGRVPWSQQRKCLHCGRLALRDREVCQGHGGRRGAAVAGPDRVQARVLDAFGRDGLLPAALVNLDLWQALVRRPMAVRAPAQLALVLAWSSRDQDPAQWSSVWRAATRAVQDHAAKR